MPSSVADNGRLQEKTLTEKEFADSLFDFYTLKISQTKARMLLYESSFVQQKRQMKLCKSRKL